MRNLNDARQALCLKLLCERCDRYTASIRAMLHLFFEEKPAADPLIYDDLQHITNLLTQEIEQLSLYLDEAVEEALEE